jgi:outer membrane protein TolC
MKSWLHHVVFCLSILVMGGGLRAQDLAPDAIAGLQLRSLNDLLAAAENHSPLLKMQRLDAELLYSDLRLLKKEWSNYVALSSSFQIGNVQFIDNLSAGSVPDVRTVTRENVFAVAGVSVRLPLSDFLTKAERRRQLELKLEQQRYDVEQKTFELREVVIRQYNNLQRALRVLDIRSRDLNFHEMTTEMAERYFREGNMSLEDYTNAFNKRNEAEVRLEETKLDAHLLFLLLREVVGTEIEN